MGKIDNKVIRALTKLIDSGYVDEKAILAMTMDDILALPKITIAEIETINRIHKAVRANKLVTLLCSGEKPGKGGRQEDIERSGEKNDDRDMGNGVGTGTGEETTSPEDMSNEDGARAADRIVGGSME